MELSLKNQVMFGRKISLKYRLLWWKYRSQIHASGKKTCSKDSSPRFTLFLQPFYFSRSQSTNL